MRKLQPSGAIPHPNFPNLWNPKGRQSRVLHAVRRRPAGRAVQRRLARRRRTGEPCGRTAFDARPRRPRGGAAVRSAQVSSSLLIVATVRIPPDGLPNPTKRTRRRLPSRTSRLRRVDSESVARIAINARAVQRQAARPGAGRTAAAVNRRGLGPGGPSTRRRGCAGRRRASNDIGWIWVALSSRSLHPDHHEGG